VGAQPLNRNRAVFLFRKRLQQLESTRSLSIGSAYVAGHECSSGAKVGLIGKLLDRVMCLGIASLKHRLVG
jgi:hypothetical protein